MTTCTDTDTHTRTHTHACRHSSCPRLVTCNMPAVHCRPSVCVCLEGASLLVLLSLAHTQAMCADPDAHMPVDMCSASLFLVDSRAGYVC